MTIRGYQDLVVWQRSVDLALAIYQASESFPKREIYGLSAQLRRAAISIPSNIAEGHGREHLGDYLHHLSIANGSLMELETQVIIAARRDFLSAETQSQILERSGEVGRMLAGLIRSLKRRQRSCRP
jgi:four helix bundle protein